MMSKSDQGFHHHLNLSLPPPISYRWMDAMILVVTILVVPFCVRKCVQRAEWAKIILLPCLPSGWRAFVKRFRLIQLNCFLHSIHVGEFNFPRYWRASNSLPFFHSHRSQMRIRENICNATRIANITASRHICYCYYKTLLCFALYDVLEITKKYCC